nr:hypothetical protein [Tanacetum cinerariifolium]
GKQPAKVTKAKSPSALLEVAMTEAEQLKLTLKRSRQQTHISQPGGSGIDEGTGSKPGVLDVPFDDSDEEISWKSFDDEDSDDQEQDKHDNEGDEKDESDDGEGDDDGDDDDRDDDTEEQEIPKTDEHDDTERGGDEDEVSESEEEDDDDKETREDESFNPIPRTPKESKDDDNDEEEQDLKAGEEVRITEEEETDELYRNRQALVEAYEADMIILDTYGDRVILKRRCEDDDDQEGPFAGSDRGSKRRRECGEHALADTPSEPASRSAGRKSTKRRRISWIGSTLKTKAADYGHIKWIEDLVPHTMWIQEPINYDKHALWGVSHWGQKRQQFYGLAVNRESALDVYSKRRIIAVANLKIVEWHNYKHLDWILVRRDDEKIYKFKEDDFKRLRL